MNTVLLAALLLVQDHDEKRITLLRRVAAAMVEHARPDSHLLLRGAHRPFDQAIRDYERAIKIKPNLTLVHTLGAIGTPAARLRGFFVDDKGTFVTTASATLESQGKVRISDGREAKAILLARVESLGLAVFKVEATSTALALGDSTQIRVGQTLSVLTRAGEAPALRPAVLLGRDARWEKLLTIDDFLHLDYPALSTETGSAVLNAAGEVVGILASPIYEEDQTQGTKILVPRRAYAIPSNTIQVLLKTLKARGKFERGYLGIALFEEKAGLRITMIEPQSAAAEGGLKEGDVIVQVDGIPVRKTSALIRIVAFKAGQKIQIALQDGRKVALTVGVRKIRISRSDTEILLWSRVGVAVTYLSKDLRRYLELPPEREDRWIIRKVRAGGPAAAAGIRKGDVILAVDQNEIRSESALAEQILKTKKGAYAVFEVLTGGRRIKVIVTVE